ncbi:ATP-dependent dethiobiotin synthetase BioD [Desulfobacterium sp. N47]|uniref:ATP-dependent dethiobiotin synthetase BioD n=1 Tax=uncultured Desulfobacterium sp. TaxID=201089 RepID=E1YM05_9BACT|nr:Dethiobiotin synthetase [uncultured Desulfobacterium sp.]
MKQFEKGVFITATDTEVGKTFVSALLLKALLKQNIKAGYFKPVASGCQTENGFLVSEDLLYVEKFTGIKMEHDLHCPVRYQKPLAPVVAAELEKKPVDPVKIKKAFELLKQKYSALIVEGIGGVMVPLSKNYLVLDLIADFNLPALIVSRPTLGTINHTLLTISVLKNKGIPIAGFLTNGDKEENDEAAASSPEIIAGLGRVTYLGHIPMYNFKKDNPDDFIEKKAFFIKKLADGIASIKENNPLEPPFLRGKKWK